MTGKGPDFKPDQAGPVSPGEERDNYPDILNPPTFPWPGNANKDMMKKSEELTTSQPGDTK